MMRRKQNTSNSPEPCRRSPGLDEKETIKWGSSEDLKGAKHLQQHSSTMSSSTSGLPAISQAKDGSVILRVFAKPGAKRNAVTDIGPNSVAIQIGAPARDSQANIELVAYLGSLLHLRKSNISIDIGLRSKIKTVKITKDGFSTDNLRELLSQEIAKPTG